MALTLGEIFKSFRVSVAGGVEAVRHLLKIPYILNSEILQSPPKPREIYVFLHGIGNTLHSWDKVYAKMPDDVMVIGIDLLGFGDSPKPIRAVYSARFQARSVMSTLVRLGLGRRPIIVGHSLGGLVAVEIARKYPLLVKSLILCSPPLYGQSETTLTRRFSRELALKRLYRVIRKHPSQLEALAPLVVGMGIANPSLSVNDQTVGAYIASLESSIINQSSLADIKKLSLPVDIMYGSLDPLVIASYIQALPLDKPNIKVHKILASHEVVGRYVGRLVKLISSK